MDFGGLFSISFDWINQILSGLGNVLLTVVQDLLNEAMIAINWLISLIPQLPGFPVALSLVSTAFAYIMVYIGPTLAAWNYYVALNVALVFAATALIAEGAASVFHAIRWILTKIPFIGGAE